MDFAALLIMLLFFALDVIAYRVARIYLGAGIRWWRAIPGSGYWLLIMSLRLPGDEQ
jgi:hypothetical protein